MGHYNWSIIIVNNSRDYGKENEIILNMGVFQVESDQRFQSYCCFLETPRVITLVVQRKHHLVGGTPKKHPFGPSSAVTCPIWMSLGLKCFSCHVVTKWWWFCLMVLYMGDGRAPLKNKKFLPSNSLEKTFWHTSSTVNGKLWQIYRSG